jgi:hypothetical protein
VSINAALIFAEEYRSLRPRAPMPEIHLRFKRYTSLSTRIQLKDEKLQVSLSDLLEGAPEPILRAIAHILLAKLYRKPIDATQNLRYRRYTNSAAISEKAEQIRRIRGRKVNLGPQGRFFNLENVFDDLNLRFFNGLMGRPVLTWSGHSSRRSLGHYDAAHNTIVVSRIFDRPNCPLYVLEYLLYHEMLHLKHPIKVHGTRRCVHPKAFRDEEKLFPHWDEAQRFLKRFL